MEQEMGGRKEMKWGKLPKIHGSRLRLGEMRGVGPAPGQFLLGMGKLRGWGWLERGQRPAGAQSARKCVPSLPLSVVLEQKLGWVWCLFFFFLSEVLGYPYGSQNV